MTDKGASREALQAEIVRRRMGAGSIPEPPYQVRGVDMLYLMCRFARDDVARIVPPGLTPAASCWGPISVYSVKSGWGIAPFSAFFMALEVEGYESPDGSPAMYMHSGLYSDLGGEVMTTKYNRNFRIGGSRQWQEGHRIIGEGMHDGKVVVRVGGDLGDPVANSLNGIHNYIGRRGDGGLQIYSVSFSGEFGAVEHCNVDYLPLAGDLINSIEPVEFVWPMVVRGLSMTFSAPRPIGPQNATPEHDNFGNGLVALFSRMGRAAVILGRDGLLCAINHEAERLVTQGRLKIDDGRLHAPRRNDSRILDAMVGSLRGGGLTSVSERTVLPGEDGTTLLAQAVILDASVAGEGGLLVFFDDPARPIVSDPGPALRLLGLTPAEAKIAGLVGAGRSPREAADELQLTLNTVRSALKIVFDKLGIGRQSELAKIVARLAG